MRRAGLVEAAAKISEVLKQGKAIGKALSSTEDAQQIRTRLKNARARVEHSSAVDPAYPWQRQLPEALDRCAGVFRLPGGGGEPFARVGDELVSVDAEHGYHVRDDAVRARPEDVVLVRGLVPKPAAPAAPARRIALDIGTKSGDGFVGFVETHARELGVDPDALEAVIGVDLNQTKLAGAVDHGVLPVLADGSRLPFADDSFDLVVAMELLEHVPPEIALGICREIRRVSRGAVFIQNPDFTEEAYLAELGLKFSWMGWKEHCHHITQDDLRAFLREAGFGSELCVERVMPVSDSSHPLIVPLDAPAQTQRYAEEVGPKPAVRFERPVFEKLRVALL